MKTIDKILYRMKREGPVTAKILAEEFQLTTMGVRQHLQGLEEDGLVDFEDIKAKVGRPTRHWHLTQKGTGVLPTATAILLFKCLILSRSCLVRKG